MVSKKKSRRIVLQYLRMVESEVEVNEKDMIFGRIYTLQLEGAHYRPLSASLQSENVRWSHHAIVIRLSSVDQWNLTNAIHARSRSSARANIFLVIVLLESSCKNDTWIVSLFELRKISSSESTSVYFAFERKHVSRPIIIAAVADQTKKVTRTTTDCLDAFGMFADALSCVYRYLHRSSQIHVDREAKKLTRNLQSGKHQGSVPIRMIGDISTCLLFLFVLFIYCNCDLYMRADSCFPVLFDRVRYVNLEYFCSSTLNGDRLITHVHLRRC
jgi:hypothetical protein